MEIILIVALGYLLWKVIGPKINSGSEDGDEPRNLTETQKRWREQNWLPNRDEHRDPRVDDQVQLTDAQIEWRQKRDMERLKEFHGEQADTQQRFQAMGDYIEQNMRKFNIWEWLFWQIDLRFFGAYMIYIAPMVIFGVMLPLLLGWPVLWLVVAGFIIYSDVKAYQRHRLMEVTVWNPEWHEKFVDSSNEQ